MLSVLWKCEWMRVLFSWSLGLVLVLWLFSGVEFFSAVQEGAECNATENISMRLLYELNQLTYVAIQTLNYMSLDVRRSVESATRKTWKREDGKTFLKTLIITSEHFIYSRDRESPLTKFSELWSSCVVDAHLVMRDLNIQPTTTVSIFWARDLSPPVVKLFPKPALSAKTNKTFQLKTTTWKWWLDKITDTKQCMWKPINEEGRFDVYKMKGEKSIAHMIGRPKKRLWDMKVCIHASGCSLWESSRPTKQVMVWFHIILGICLARSTKPG